MAKAPWEENVYDKGEETLKRSKKSVDAWANRMLTILAVVFFIIVIVIVATMFYLSTGGSNEKKATEGFYSSDAAVSKISSASEISQTEKNEPESSQSSSPGTITVQSGEGEASIAARAGVSIAQLEQLNPQHMTQGYWYANPGDVVKTQ